MRILVPFNNFEVLDDYIDAGACEFYLGFYDEKWSETFGEYEDINRMSGYKEMANKNDINGVKKIIDVIKKKGQNAYITFNSSMYSQEELDFIREYFEQLKDTGVDGVIVSCIELVIMAKEVGINSVISTIAGVYNSDLAKYYVNNGASRIILPRDLTLEEIDHIIQKVKNTEYEVFIMRNGCTFSDSNCLGFHRKEMCSICASLSRANCEIITPQDDFKIRHDLELNNMLYHDYFHNNACGLCSIYRFVQQKITACKVVGRTDEIEYVLKDIRLIRDNIRIAEECQSEDEYLKKMIFPENKREACKLGLSCYYPEIRF